MSQTELGKTDLHAEPLQHALWRAGAGAGKTYNLVQRVLSIVDTWRKEHQEFPRLVVTTFTRMATQELRVRLMEAALERTAIGQNELIPFVTSRSQLFVTTMHGVMDSYLRSFGSAIGLEAGFRVGNQDEIETMVRRVGKTVLFSKTEKGLEANHQTAVDRLLNEIDFQSAVTLLSKVSRICREFRDARSARADEYLASIAHEVQGAAVELSGLHAEIGRGDRTGKWREYSTWLKLLIDRVQGCSWEQEESTNTLSELTQLVENEPKITNSGGGKIDFAAGGKWKEPTKNFAKTLERSIEELEILPSFIDLNDSLTILEKSFSKTLAGEKLRSGLIEIEDLELLALQLSREHPATAATFAEGWDHWLIDEYQDTSPRQVQLIQALSQGRPQFVVGDPQQSIYLFRGARPHVFKEKETHFVTTESEVVALEDNRRSHPEVMRFINGMVEKLGPEFSPMRAHREGLKNFGRREESVHNPLGHVTFLYLDPLLNESGKNEPIDRQRERESARVAAAVAHLCEQGASPASIALLARSNKEIRLLGTALRKAAVPFQVHTSGAFSDRLEIGDMCAFLGFLSNPHDDNNLIHLGRTPWFPLDEELLATGYRRKDSLWSRIELDPGCEFLNTALLAARERGVVQAFREALVSCGFFVWCGALDPSGRREANAFKFLSMLVNAERQMGFLPRRFIDEVMGGGDRGKESESGDRDAVAAIKPDRVHVMTIHASKGLEFDHVFLPFLASSGAGEKVPSSFVFHEQKQIWSAGVAIGDEGKFTSGPLGREWTEIVQDWSLEEAKRVLYVALTRARESLFLSATGEPDENSFLAMLELPLVAGPHACANGAKYQVLKELDGTDVLSADRESGQEPRASYSQTAVASGNSFGNTTVLLAPQSISVTRLLELEEQKGGSAANDRMDRGRRSLAMAKLAARGTRLHRVFELAKPDPSRSATMTQEVLAAEISRWFVPEERADAQQALRWLLELREPNLNAVLMNGFPEWSFTYLRSDPVTGLKVSVDGQIDLWGRDEASRLWVIDYKTGDPGYRDKAISQLKLYAEALRAAGEVREGETLGLAAVYPFAGEVFIEDFLF